MRWKGKGVDGKMEHAKKVVRRRGGELALCKCKDCGAWHVRGKDKPEKEKQT